MESWVAYSFTLHPGQIRTRVGIVVKSCVGLVYTPLKLDEDEESSLGHSINAIFTLYPGQIRTNPLLRSLPARLSFTLHSGQIRTHYANLPMPLFSSFTLHSGQIRTVAVDERGRVIDTFTLHSGQIRTGGYSGSFIFTLKVHTPLRSDGD